MAIRKRKAGGFQVEIFVGRETVDGRTKRRVRAKTFRLKKDAEKWEREQRTLQDRTGWVAPATGTLDAFLDGWLNGPVRVKVSSRTLASYRRVLANYVRPTLGGVRLNRLNTLTLETLYAELREKGLASRTVRYAHAVLRSALNVAVRDRMLPSNPAAGAALPAREATRHTTLSKTDALKFLAATRNDRLGALWNVLIYTGLRPGEALGLQWEDVNLDTSTLSVRRALLAAEKGIPAELADPKTEKARRAVQLASETVAALQRHRRVQAAERLKAGEVWEDHGLVFASPTGRPLRHDVVYKRDFLPALKAAKVATVTLYELRHTAATLRLEAGTPMKAVQELLGHSSMTLTADVYSHVSPTLQAESVAQLRRYLAGPKRRK